MVKFSNFLKLLIVLVSFAMDTQAQLINPCVAQNAIRVVVLGSSTAAGAGVSTSDSAWVNRYEDYLLSINPNNEVINLAQGGYTTYRIMRTGFVPPPNRPNPDVNKNISAALALDPDAIIVNMPSNDVSNGYSYQEQMDNLDSIVAFSNTASVPIWICTTQPKNYTDSLLRQLQFDIKDSILQFYSPNTIDFWTTIALPNHSIDPFYDSGDGTHLSDAGHAILNQRVIAANIPSAVYSPLPSVDYAILDISPNGFVGCGDSLTYFSLVIANVGISDTTNLAILIEGQNTLNGTFFSDTLSLNGGLNSCEIDTLNFFVNLYEEGNYSILAHFNLPADTISYNDSLEISLESLGHPTLVSIPDSLCSNGNGQLFANTNSQDTVFWYNSITDSIPIGFGQNFTTGLLTNTTTYYAEAVRGDLFYRDEIETTLNSNINWNGAMIDLVAHQDLQLDSFFVKINTPGNQQIEIYTKTGSHLGFELTSSAWTLLGTTTVNVLDPDNFTDVALGNISLLNGDTLGVYFQMTNPNSKMSYKTIPSPISRSTNEIEIITGSGVSTNFSNNYYPRDLNCGAYFHYGSRPEGDCSTGKIPVTAYVSNTALNLGNDTIIDIADTLILSCPTGYSNYNWSIGTVNDTALIIANNLGFGIHYISASFTDSLGCYISDSLIVGIADLVGLKELKNDFFIYPNPATHTLNFSKDVQSLQIRSLLGNTVLSQVGKFNKVGIGHLPKGLYILDITTSTDRTTLKFVKE